MVGRGLFLGVFFIAYAIQAITGFAGNIIAMPAGMATVGMQESVAMLNATGMIGCGVLAIQNWKHINWRELAIMLVVMTPFMFVGIWPRRGVAAGHSVEDLRRHCGGRGCAPELVLKQQRFMPKWLLAVLLVLAGLIQGMFVSGRRHSRDLRAPAPSGQRPVPRNAFVHLDGAQFRVCRAAA